MNRRELLSASALLLAGPGFALRSAAAQTAAAPTPIVLCWNENPYGPSPAARAAAAGAIDTGCRYPSDADLDDLVARIARKEGTDAQHIVTGTGSGELLCALALTLGRDGGEFIAAGPTYLELPEYAEGIGASTHFVPVDAQLQHDLAAMRAAVGPKTRAVYLCNPNNPTGTALPADAIRSFVTSLPAEVTVIVDEAYMDFTTLPGVRSVADLVDTYPVVVLRTFSKIHGMAGMRMGYAVARPELAARLRRARMTTPNLMAVRAARASLDDADFLSSTRTKILASRTRITTELTRLRRRYAVPQGNFVFFDTGMPLATFTSRMKERNVLVGRRFPPYDSWCRITIGTESEVEACVQALRATLA